MIYNIKYLSLGDGRQLKHSLAYLLLFNRDYAELLLNEGKELVFSAFHRFVLQVVSYKAVLINLLRHLLLNIFGKLFFYLLLHVFDLLHQFVLYLILDACNFSVLCRVASSLNSVNHWKYENVFLER
jgi:hypothetical protein